MGIAQDTDRSVRTPEAVQGEVGGLELLLTRVIVDDDHAGHPGRLGGSQPVVRVLDRQGGRSRESEAFECSQIGAGVGLESRRLVGRHHDLEAPGAERPLEQRMDPGAVAGRRDRDPHARGPELVQELTHPRPGLDLPLPGHLGEDHGLAGVKAAGKLRAPVLGHTPAHEVGLDAAVTPGDLEQLAVELHIPTVGEPGLLERSIECDAVAVSLAVDQGAIDIEHNRFQDVVALGSRWSVHAAHSFPSRERHSILPTAPRVSLSGMRIPAELAAADRRHLWHPFTQQRSWESDEPPIVIDHAEGTTLYDIYGNAYIDGVSSLWCNVHGHREPAIDGAVKAQLDRVAHSTMLGLSHAPGIELAERLLAVAPPGLSRVFYSDRGSTAVEIALKMAFQWWAQRGETERTGFICLENAYHGDTLGAVSVGGIDLFHSLYRPLLFDAWQARAGDAGHLEELLDEHGPRVAALIIEPLVQGAGGMLMQPEGYLRRVRELCDAHSVLLICDEVATGLGRTGAMFACDHENVTPDLMCVGKGLTGGYLPLAATLTTERIYDGFLGDYEDFRTFFHGHTYTGNPLACAAGIATLELFEHKRTLARLQPKIELLTRLLTQRIGPLPAVADVRQRGFMVGIELIPSADGNRVGHQVTLAARARGAIIRPLGDVVVLMPPLAISDGELRRLVTITASAIAEATSGRLPAAA